VKIGIQMYFGQSKDGDKTYQAQHEFKNLTTSQS